MGFMSGLKKFGLQANKFDGLIPVIGAYVHAGTSLIPNPKADEVATAILSGVSVGLLDLQNIILNIEASGQAVGLTGAQKAAAAAPLIMQLLANLPMTKGKKPVDPEQTKKDAADVAGAVAKYFNGYE